MFSLLICKPHSVKLNSNAPIVHFIRNTWHRARSSADSWKPFKHFWKDFFFPYWHYDSVTRLLSRSPLHLHRANSADDDLTFVTCRVAQPSEDGPLCSSRDGRVEQRPPGLLWSSGLHSGGRRRKRPPWFHFVYTKFWLSKIFSQSDRINHESSDQTVFFQHFFCPVWRGACVLCTLGFAFSSLFRRGLLPLQPLTTLRVTSSAVRSPALPRLSVASSFSSCCLSSWSSLGCCGWPVVSSRSPVILVQSELRDLSLDKQEPGVTASSSLFVSWFCYDRYTPGGRHSRTSLSPWVAVGLFTSEKAGWWAPESVGPRAIARVTCNLLLPCSDAEFNLKRVHSPQCIEILPCDWLINQLRSPLIKRVTQVKWSLSEY